MTLPDPQTTKIVIVEDQRFYVPRESSEHDIRNALAATFPGILNARADTSTTTEHEHTWETLTFTKVAGTKGVAPLPERLCALRPEPPVPDLGLQLAALLNGSLAIGEALDRDVIGQIRALVRFPEEPRLCGRLAQLGAVVLDVDDLT